MNYIKKGIGVLLLFLAVMFILPQEVKAADSYTNAKDFFDSVDNDNHIEFDGNTIYYATKSKAASSNAKTRWWCIGWEIKLKAGDKSVTVVINRYNNGTLKNICAEQLIDGYKYNLYAINYADLCKLMAKKDPTAWATISKQHTIYIYMNAILSWKPAGSDELAGYLTSADGATNVTFNDRSKVYFLSNEQERNAAVEHLVSSVDRFAGYYNLYRPLKNNELNIQYHSDIPASLGLNNLINTGNSSSLATTTKTGCTINSSSKLLTNNGISTYTTYRFEVSTLKDPVTFFGLTKKGYKLLNLKIKCGIIYT